ncbi:unnamed protein product [Prorocentrum cordatum]|uniref:PITH domain-containing protein n=1 Tax=Prorocentrum cordatum TaxID=2364126 RepID=A0ABN9WX23_9DINO|nr:unnamed protein product [Polarella glacialis]
MRAVGMKGVSNESSNTDMMRQHQMRKVKVVGDGMKHEDVDLMVCTDVVDKTRTAVLNGCSDYAAFLDVLDKNPDDKCMVSDVDPQLIMKVFFKEKVNLSAVTLRFSTPPRKGEEDEEVYAKPRLIKLYTGASVDEMDFSDIDIAEPKAIHIVEGEDETEACISCRGGKFQRLECLAILIEEAADADATRSYVNRVCISGHQAESYHAHYK